MSAPHPFSPRLPTAVPDRRAGRILRHSLALGASLAVAVFPSGCASRDFVKLSQHSLDRAMRVERPADFFGPVLARARGDTDIPAPPALVRQHHLAIVANLEGIGPRGEEELRRDGLLGQAYVLKALANWRLGRLAAARAAAAKVRLSGQEALDQRERALFHALEGVLQLETAIAVQRSGASYDSVLQYVGGQDGAWRALGAARVEAGRGSALERVLLETRLAVFKILKDAHEGAAGGSAGPAPAADDTWARLRAEAQVELTELAALSAADPAAHAAVRQWQVLCGLEPPVR